MNSFYSLFGFTQEAYTSPIHIHVLENVSGYGLNDNGRNFVCKRYPITKVIVFYSVIYSILVSAIVNLI